MKPVRVGSALYVIGPLACPRCGRLGAPHLAAFGILRPTCEGKRCHMSWTAVRLPPGVRGRQLLGIIGPGATRALLEALHPTDHARSDTELADVDLGIHQTDPIYVQRAPDSPEPLMGWHQAQSILTSLLGTR